MGGLGLGRAVRVRARRAQDAGSGVVTGWQWRACSKGVVVRGHALVSLSRAMLTRYLTLTRYLIEGLAIAS